VSLTTRIGSVTPEFGTFVLRERLVRNDPGDWGDEPRSVACGVLRSTNFTNEGLLNLNEMALRSFSEAKYAEKRLHHGDIVIERSGGSDIQPVGRVGFIDEHLADQGYTFSNFVQRITVNHSLNCKFVYYCLQRMYEMGVTLGMQSQTTGIRNLDYRLFIRSVLPEPEKVEQDAIVSAIESIDIAIAAIVRSVTEAERVKAALMQQLLTGRMKADGTIRSKEEFGEHPKLGFVPKGWKTCRVHEIATKVTDGEHATPKRSTSGFYLLSARNIGDGQLLLNDVDFIEQPELDRIRKRCDPDKDDLLISCSGTIGNVCLVPDGIICGMVRSAALVKLATTKCVPQFIEWLFRSTRMHRQMQVSASVSIQGNLFQGAIRRLWLALPSEMDEQSEIADRLSSLQTLIKAKGEKIKALQKLKKSFMQNFLTGKVRLPANRNLLAKAL
jgi:type I restriction enzyme S subunit